MQILAGTAVEAAAGKIGGAFDFLLYTSIKYILVNFALPLLF